VRPVEHVPRVHLPGDQQGETDDQPGERLADEGTHLVDEEQEFLHDDPNAWWPVTRQLRRPPGTDKETATRLAPDG
jgi:hypothetical protein